MGCKSTALPTSVQQEKQACTHTAGHQYLLGLLGPLTLHLSIRWSLWINCGSCPIAFLYIAPRTCRTSQTGMGGYLSHRTLSLTWDISKVRVTCVRFHITDALE